MFRRSTAQLPFGMPECVLSVVCGKQREMKRTSNEKSEVLLVMDDDKAHKVTWDLAKFLYIWLQNT